jgi:hypothetical protein
MNFDMNTVWSRGVELVRDNFSLLVVIAGVFLLLPTIATYLLIPGMQTFIDPTADPDIVAAQMLEMGGSIILYGLLAAIIQFAGYGAMIALTGKHRPTVGEAIVSGFKIVPSLFVVLIVFVIAYFVGAFLLLLPFSLLAAASGSGALALIGIIPVLIYVAWLGARLSMTMPVMVLEHNLNPFSAMGRSISLTGPKQWQILLFWVVLMVVFVVVSLLFNGVVGLIAALMGSGTTAMLILGLANGATGMASGILICALSVAMHSQLSGPNAATIEEPFD